MVAFALGVVPVALVVAAAVVAFALVLAEAAVVAAVMGLPFLSVTVVVAVVVVAEIFIVHGALGTQTPYFLRASCSEFLMKSLTGSGSPLIVTITRYLMVCTQLSSVLVFFVVGVSVPR